MSPMCASTNNKVETYLKDKYEYFKLIILNLFLYYGAPFYPKRLREYGPSPRYILSILSENVEKKEVFCVS